MAFALDFAGLRSGRSGDAGLALLASWWAFAVCLAVILVDIPRGSTRS